MDAINAAWAWFWSLEPNWDLLLRFIEVLAWPVITLVGLAMIRPGRIVDALLDGGEVGVGPATLRFKDRVQEIAAAVERNEELAPESERPIENPLQESADPYTTVMNGWGKVIEGLEQAVERAGVGQLDRRNPIDAVLRLRRANMIGRKLQSNIQELWDFRNRVVRAGSRQLERMGLTQEQADEYYSTADRVRRAILNAIGYRESKGMIGARKATTSPGDGSSAAQLN